MTDGTWKSAPANPAPDPGWEQAGYDDSGWSNVVELAPDGGLINFPTPPLGIWDADHSSFPNRTYLRKTFALNNADHMIFDYSVDDDAIIYINGLFVTQDNDCSAGTHRGIDVTSYLNLNGTNTIAVLATDCGGGYTFAAQLYNGYYVDNDGDGFGSNALAAVCAPGPGLVLNNFDCNDESSTVTIAKAWYADFDGDGFGVNNDSIYACYQPDVVLQMPVIAMIPIQTFIRVQLKLQTMALMKIATEVI